MRTMKHRNVALGLCIVIALTSCVAPGLARASGDDLPIRLYATASPGVIGNVVGDLFINGRAGRGEQLVWEGDLLQARADWGASVLLDSIGRVTLGRGAIARLATSDLTRDDQTSGRVLVASLVMGEIDVKLDVGVSSFVQANGSAYASSDGASFRIGIREGRVVTSAMTGAVSVAIRAPQRRYDVIPVGHGSDIVVRAGKLVYIRVRVRDESGKALPEMPVFFSLSPGAGGAVGMLGLGTLSGTSYSTLTNDEGIAAVPFQAARTRGTTSITAIVQETGASWTGQITVEPGPSGGKTAAILIGVGAGIGAGIAIVKATDKDDPIQIQPPVIQP